MFVQEGELDIVPALRFQTKLSGTKCCANTH